MMATRKWLVGLAAVGGVIASGTTTVFAEGGTGLTQSVSRAHSPSTQQLEQRLQTLTAESQTVAGQVKSAHDQLLAEIAAAEAAIASATSAPAYSSAAGPPPRPVAAVSATPSAPPPTEAPATSTTEPPTTASSGDGGGGTRGGDSGGDN
jgi:hypothetical protein